MPEQFEQIPPAPQAQPGGLSENATSALAYITFIPAIIFLAMPPYNQSAKVRFHCWQSIFLAIAVIVIEVAIRISLIVPGLILIMAPIAMIIWLALFVLWLIVVLNALNGKIFRIPIIADFAAKQSGM